MSTRDNVLYYQNAQSLKVALMVKNARLLSLITTIFISCEAFAQTIGSGGAATLILLVACSLFLFVPIISTLLNLYILGKKMKISGQRKPVVAIHGIGTALGCCIVVFGGAMDFDKMLIGVGVFTPCIASLFSFARIYDLRSSRSQ